MKYNFKYVRFKMNIINYIDNFYSTMRPVQRMIYRYITNVNYYNDFRQKETLGKSQLIQRKNLKERWIFVSCLINLCSDLFPLYAIKKNQNIYTGTN